MSLVTLRVARSTIEYEPDVKSVVSTNAVFGLLRDVGAAEVTLSCEGGSVSLRKRRVTSVSQGSASTWVPP
jgi:hypothetical protein